AHGAGARGRALTPHERGFLGGGPCDRGWRNGAAGAIGWRPRTRPAQRLQRNNRMQEERAERPAASQAAQTAAELARPIGEALAGGNQSRVRELAHGLSAPDIADVIELLEPEARVRFILTLG